jgi:L-ascorbate metabolism protein UlaG (beta-lactamase superfamily)
MLRALASATLVLALGLAGCSLFRPTLEVPAAWEMSPAPAGTPGVTATFMGVSTLVLRDGTTTLVIDGFFSRPGVLDLAGDIEPDPARIDEGLALAGVSNAAAIFTVHSHFDHAMDTGEVAKRTGAVVVGSASTANAARGAGVPETQIQETQVGDVVSFGDFQVRFLPGKHYPLPGSGAAFLGTSIDAPLVPPAPMSAWGEGRSEALLFEHPSGNLLVIGSAGFVPGALTGFQADTVMLGIGGLGREEASYRDDYWENTVLAVGANRIHPLHWDDFTKPLDEPLLPGLNSDIETTFEFLEARSATDGVAIGWLPFAQPVLVF